MPDDPKAEDSLAPAVKNRSVAQGDVPDALKRRYYTDERGRDGLGFYVDARIQAPFPRPGAVSWWRRGVIPTPSAT